MDFGPPAGAFWAPRPTAMKQRSANTGRIRRARINDQPPCGDCKRNKKDESCNGYGRERATAYFLATCRDPGSERLAPLVGPARFGRFLSVSSRARPPSDPRAG